MSSAISVITGNLGADPDLKYGENGGAAYVKLSIATSKRYKVNGNWEDRTTWWRATGFGKQAETIAQNFNKGDEIQVTGETALAEFVDRDGVKRSVLELDIAIWKFGSKKKGDGESNASQAPKTTKPDLRDEDIPF